MSNGNKSKKTGIIASTITVALLLTAGVASYIVYQNNQNAARAASTPVPTPPSVDSIKPGERLLNTGTEGSTPNTPSSSDSGETIDKPNIGGADITAPTSDQIKTEPSTNDWNTGNPKSVGEKPEENSMTKPADGSPNANPPSTDSDSN